MLGGRPGKVKMEIRNWKEKSLEGESGKVHKNKEASQKQSHRLWLEGFSYCHGGRGGFSGEGAGGAGLGVGAVDTGRPRQAGVRGGRRVAVAGPVSGRREPAVRAGAAGPGEPTGVGR